MFGCLLGPLGVPFVSAPRIYRANHLIHSRSVLAQGGTRQLQRTRYLRYLRRGSKDTREGKGWPRYPVLEALGAKAGPVRYLVCDVCSRDPCLNHHMSSMSKDFW